MAKKQHVLIIDTETANNGKVVDFAAVVVDRKGEIKTQCAILTHGVFDNRTQENELFSDPNSSIDSIWNRKRLSERYADYNSMLESGVRVLASVAAINRWLDKAAITYAPYLTAYNLPFDVDKCEKTGIDLTMLSNRFCLWAVAADRWVQTKKYKNFALQVHAFNNVTRHGNMTYKANAETMARFVLGMPDFPDEPHTALEDIIDYELPIFRAAVKGRKLSDFVGLTSPAWQQMQIKDHFTAK